MYCEMTLPDEVLRTIADTQPIKPIWMWILGPVMYAATRRLFRLFFLIIGTSSSDKTCFVTPQQCEDAEKGAGVVIQSVIKRATSLHRFYQAITSAVTIIYSYYIAIHEPLLTTGWHYYQYAIYLMCNGSVMSTVMVSCASNIGMTGPIEQEDPDMPDKFNVPGIMQLNQLNFFGKIYHGIRILCEAFCILMYIPIIATNMLPGAFNFTNLFIMFIYGIYWILDRCNYTTSCESQVSESYSVEMMFVILSYMYEESLVNAYFIFSGVDPLQAPIYLQVKRFKDSFSWFVDNKYILLHLLGIV